MITKYIFFPYYLALRLRHALYDKGVKKSRKFPVPVYCVGNIAVGGTGKTPMTEYLCALLEKQGRVAVLSRGYKRRSRGFRLVETGSPAEEVGDEPLQIKLRFPGITVAVDGDRSRGISTLLAMEPAPECIVLDDAFQHRAVVPSKSIVMMDYSRPLYSDELLPIGRLRDIPSRIRKADAVVVSKCPTFVDDWERSEIRSRLRLAPSQKLFFACIKYLPFRPLFKECGDVRYTYSKQVFLISGIADPRPLEVYLCGWFDTITHEVFPDHHNFTAKDIRSITRFAEENPTVLLLTTEKDGARLLGDSRIPDAIKPRLFYIPIEMEFLTENEAAEFAEFTALS